MLAILPILIEIRVGKFDFFNLKNPFILYFTIQLGISGLVTLYTGKASSIGLDPFHYSDVYELASVYSTIGLFMFLIGYYTQKNIAIKLPAICHLKWHSINVHLILTLYLFLGYACLIMLIQKNGGLSTFLANRESWRAGGMIGQGFLLFPATSLLALTAIFHLVFTLKSKVSKRRLIYSYITLCLAIIPPLLLGFRSAFALPLIQFMVIWNYAYKTIKPFKLVVILLIIGIVFTGYGISRQIPHGISVSPAVLFNLVINDPELAYAVFYRSKGTEVVTTVINKLQQTREYDLGYKSIYEALTIIIPNSLWEGKPKPSSVRFTSYFFGDELRFSRDSTQDDWGGVSPTAIGELYWHFGLIGIIVGLFLLGKITKLLYTTMKQNINNKVALITYSILYTTFAMFAETFQGYTNGLVMFIIVILITTTLFSLSIFISTTNGCKTT